jgi:hypothetical protein
MTPELRAAAREYPVVTLLGPRQSGKTTLVRHVFADKPYRSLEDPDVRAFAQEDARGFLATLPDGGILDEVQRAPEVLSYVQGIVDRDARPGRFIVTGSHQPAVHEAVSQSLAGRTAVLTLLPLSIAELGHYERTWSPFERIVLGAYPRLHEHDLDAQRFFNGYIQTYVERDVRALIQLKDLRTFQRFLTLLAGRVGQLLNYSSLSNDVGVSSTTIKSWISVLSASFVVFELPPYFANVGKRVVKSPKLYFTDTGLAAHLIGLRTAAQAARDPLRGGLFENLIVLDVLKQRLNQGHRPELYFYRDARGHEVDLIVRHGRRLVPIEIKSAATFTPQFTESIVRLQAVLGEQVAPGAVVYTGAEDFTFQGTRVLNPLQGEGTAELQALVLAGG